MAMTMNTTKMAPPPVPIPVPVPIPQPVYHSPPVASSSSQRSTQSSQAQLPVSAPSAVRMGDLVYLPVFKLNSGANSVASSNVNPSNRHPANLLPPPPPPQIPSMRIDESTIANLTTKPLDLSSKQRQRFEEEDEESQEGDNMPLDLSKKPDKSPNKKLDKFKNYIILDEIKL